MRRPYEPPAYDTALWPDSHWRASTALPGPAPRLDGATRASFAVIGAGFTGLNAALAARAISHQRKFACWAGYY